MQACSQLETSHAHRAHPYRPPTAQDRMPSIPPEKFHEARKKEDAFVAARKGLMFGPFSVLDRSRELMNPGRLSTPQAFDRLQAFQSLRACGRAQHALLTQWWGAIEPLASKTSA